MVAIKSFSKAKEGSTTGGGGSFTTMKNADTATRLAHVHTFWGNRFDGSQDVEGNIDCKADLKVTGSSKLNELSVSGAGTFENNVTVKGSETVQGNVDVGVDLTVHGNTGLWHTDIYSDLDVIGNADFESEIKVKEKITAKDQVLNNSLQVKGKSTLKDIDATGETFLNTLEVSGDATFDSDVDVENDLTVKGYTYLNDLQVTGEAHFYNLIIDEVKSVGGQIIVSCANCIAEKVIDGDSSTPDQMFSGKEEQYFYAIPEYETMYSEYEKLKKTNSKVQLIAKTKRVLWKAENNDCSATNQWTVGDHALCHKFNIEGVAGSVSKHYWTLVCHSERTMFDNVIYNFIELLSGFEIVDQNGNVLLSKDVINGHSVNVESGDNIVQLGHSTDMDRRSAIVISAYAGNVLDSSQDLKPPYIAQYRNIDDYSLKNHLSTYFSRDKNEIQGTLKVNNGKTVEDLIGEIEPTKTNIFVAYANSKDGKTGFTTTPVDGAKYNYIGICATLSSTQPTTYSSYKWSRITYDQDLHSVVYSLIPVDSKMILSTNNVMTVTQSFQVYKIEDGVTISTITSDNAGSVISNHTFKIRSHYDQGSDTFDIPYVAGKSAWYRQWSVSGFYKSAKKNVKSMTTELILTDKESGDEEIFDRYTTQITIDSGAFLEVADGVVARVTDTEKGISELSIKAGEIESSVSDMNTKFTQIKQTSDEVLLSVGDLKTGLQNTGIDIQNQRIKVTTNNFILNNNSGEKVLDVDGQGNLILTGVMKPKRIQVQCREYGSECSQNVDETDDIYYGAVQIAPSTSFVNCNLNFNNQRYTIKHVEFAGFEINDELSQNLFDYEKKYDNKHRYTIQINSSERTTIESFYVQLFDSSGNELLDYDELKEDYNCYLLRIVSDQGTVDASKWRKLFNLYNKHSQYGQIIEDNNGHETMSLDPEMYSDSYIQRTDHMDFHYHGMTGIETFDYYDDLESWLNDAINEYEQDQRNSTSTVGSFTGTGGLSKGSLNHCNVENSGSQNPNGYNTTVKGTSATVKITLNELNEYKGTRSRYGFTRLRFTLENESTGDYTNVDVNVRSYGGKLLLNYNSYKDDLTKDRNITVSVGTSNFEFCTMSYAKIEGRYKFTANFSQTFWNKNNQLMYTTTLPFYCAGFYDFKFKVKPFNYGYYNESDGEFVSLHDDTGKEIFPVVFLPRFSTAWGNESLIGTEITFITDTYPSSDSNFTSNVYLSTQTGSFPLYYKTSSGTFAQAQQFSQYSDITTASGRAGLYKLPKGITKVCCVPDYAQGAKWIAE